MESARNQEKSEKFTALIEKKLNTEDFICEVQKHGSIWDASSEGYSNKITKVNAWNDIAVTFIDDFESRPTDEKNVILSILQRRWKSIRSSYAREVRQKKGLASGSGASNRRTYTYFEQLGFLNMTSKKSSGSLEEDENANDDPDDSSFGSFETEERPRSSKKKRNNHSDDELLISILKKKAADAKKSIIRMRINIFCFRCFRK